MNFSVLHILLFNSIIPHYLMSKYVHLSGSSIKPSSKFYDTGSNETEQPAASSYDVTKWLENQPIGGIYSDTDSIHALINILKMARRCCIWITNVF